MPITYPPSDSARRLRGVSVASTTPASGQVLTFDGSQWAPAAAAGGGSDGAQSPFRPGTTYADAYMPNVVSATASSTSFDPNRLYGLPFYSGKGMTLDELLVYVTTAIASAKARVGIYTMSATELYPDALVMDGGEIDVASTGWRAAGAGLAQALTANRWYWSVVNTSNTSTGLKAAGSTSISASVSGLPINMILRDQAFGAMPATFPSGGYPNTSTGLCPIGFFRLSAVTL